VQNEKCKVKNAKWQNFESTRRLAAKSFFILYFSLFILH